MNSKAKDPLFNIVKRDALPWYHTLGIRLLAIVAALIVCAIVTTIMTGINPIQVYSSIFLGAFGTARKTWITFQNVAILLLISLALTPAFRKSKRPSTEKVLFCILCSPLFSGDPLLNLSVIASQCHLSWLPC